MLKRLREAALRRATRLMADPRVARVIFDPRVWRLLTAALRLRSELRSAASARAKRLAR